MAELPKEIPASHKNTDNLSNNILNQPVLVEDHINLSPIIEEDQQDRNNHLFTHQECHHTVHQFSPDLLYHHIYHSFQLLVRQDRPQEKDLEPHYLPRHHQTLRRRSQLWIFLQEAAVRDLCQEYLPDRVQQVQREARVRLCQQVRLLSCANTHCLFLRIAHANHHPFTRHHPARQILRG